MRKLLLGLILVLPLCSFSQYHGFRFGARGAFGNSTYASIGWDKLGKAGQLVEGAVLMTYGIEDWFAIRAEVQFSKSDGSGSGRERLNGPASKLERYDEKFSNTGLSIPVLLHFSIPMRRIRPYLDGGLLSQMNVMTTEERTYQDENLSGKYDIANRTMDAVEPYSFTMMMNVGLEVPYGSKFSYFVEAHWNPYFTRIGKPGGNIVSMKCLSLSAGFLF